VRLDSFVKVSIEHYNIIRW